MICIFSQCKTNIFNILKSSTLLRTNITRKMTNSSVKFLSQEEAISLDRELFDEFNFSVDQLMELAGLSVAQAIASIYPSESHNKPLICCGPGNNGGDGLVCARHLKLFGYEPTVICPKPGRGQLYQNLLIQCRRFHIPIIEQPPNDSLDTLGNLIVDAIFGFSFKPPNRNPDFAKLINGIHHTSGKVPLVSIDVPSGWHVETGHQNIASDQEDVDPSLRIPALMPDCLVSLTAPKLCARHFTGSHHYLGGRFCPKSIEEKYSLNLPKYKGTQGILKLS